MIIRIRTYRKRMRKKKRILASLMASFTCGLAYPFLALPIS